MQLIQPMANLAFLTDDNGNRHCFSYNSEVAAIIDGKYIEYETPEKMREANKDRRNPDLYNSPTSKKHKAMFRAQFGIER